MQNRAARKAGVFRKAAKEIKNIISKLLSVLFPNLCVCCKRQLISDEKHLCLHCLHELPKTNFHLEGDNPVEKLFWGKAKILSGTSFFFFQKASNTQNILHLLKYKGEKEIGYTLGRYAGVDLLDSPSFMSTDLIIPVPLHPNRLKSRGYNQSEWIAKGLAETMCKPINSSNLVRSKENVSQTKKNVFERHQNTEGIFEVLDKTLFEGKQLLLVDDVITTGATLEACIQALLEIKEVKLSVFTLAIA